MSEPETTVFSLWPAYLDKQSNNYRTQGPVPTTNPWSLMRLYIEKGTHSAHEKLVSFACLEQAEYFHNTQSTAANYAARALLIYYSAMNLVKSYLIIKGFTPILNERGFSHGLRNKWKTPSGDPMDIELKLERTQSDPGLYMIFHEFLKSYGGEHASDSIEVQSLLQQIVIGHRTYSQAEIQKELFVPIKEIDYVRDSRTKTITIECKIQTKHFERHNRDGKDFLSACEIADIARVCPKRKDARVRSIQLEPPLSYTSNTTSQKLSLASVIRRKLWVMATAHEPYRKFYFYAGLTGPRFPPLCSIYALMFCLGEIARYRPYRFADMLNSEHGPQVMDFLSSISNQFLYLLASDFLEKDLERPSIV